MSAKTVSDYRRRRKLNLIHVCGDACNLCGYSKVQGALEFHHIDPSQKEFGIAMDGVCRDIEKDLAEVRKTILVCANCHREIHEGLYESSFLTEKKVFDEAVAQALVEERNSRFEKTQYFCAECGKEITHYAQSGLCSNCVKEKQRVCDRPSREELKLLIRKLPFTQIGAKFGVSDNAIRKWCKVYNLPTKKTEITAMGEAQWLEISVQILYLAP